MCDKSLLLCLNDVVMLVITYLDLNPYTPEFELYDLNRLTHDIGSVLPAIDGGHSILLNGLKVGCNKSSNEMVLFVDDMSFSQHENDKLDLLLSIILYKQYRIPQAFEEEHFSTLTKDKIGINFKFEKLGKTIEQEPDVLEYVLAKFKVSLLKTYAISDNYLLTTELFRENNKIVLNCESDEELMFRVGKYFTRVPDNDPFRTLYENKSLLAWICVH